MKRMPLVIAAATMLAAAASLAAAPTAQAQPHHATPTVHRVATTAAQQKRVKDYWTPDRMRSAEQFTVRPAAGWRPSSVQTGTPRIRPGQQKGLAKGHQEAKGNQEVRGHQGFRGNQGVGQGRGLGNAKHHRHNDDGANLGGPWIGGGEVVDTTGKVFFTLGGVDYVCSGSAVRSDNKSTVSTAGHCVNEGPGEYATNFVFVPAYDDGDAPYGKWVATSLTTSEQWRTEGDFNYDIGFATVGQVDGKDLDDVVGSQSIGFNQPRGEFLYSFGYPQAAPYDGTTLDYCSSTSSDDILGDSDDQRLDCNLTGGSSGGPWFDNFSTTDGTGVQVSVNSFGYSGEKNAMYGPYFGSVIESVYDAVQSVA